MGSLTPGLHFVCMTFVSLRTCQEYVDRPEAYVVAKDILFSLLGHTRYDVKLREKETVWQYQISRP